LTQADIVNSRLQHRLFLNECYATLILYEKASANWLVAKLQDTLKAPGLGRDLHVLPIGIVVRNIAQKEIVLKIQKQFDQYQQIVVIYQTKEVVDFLNNISY